MKMPRRIRVKAYQRKTGPVREHNRSARVTDLRGPSKMSEPAREYFSWAFKEPENWDSDDLEASLMYLEHDTDQLLTMAEDNEIFVSRDKIIDFQELAQQQWDRMGLNDGEFFDYKEFEARMEPYLEDLWDQGYNTYNAYPGGDGVHVVYTKKVLPNAERAEDA